MSNGLGGNAFARNIWFEAWRIVLYIMWHMYLQSVKVLLPMAMKTHYQENTLFGLDPRSRESMSHEMLPSTLDIMWPMHQQSLMLLHYMVKEKMHLQENTLFEIELGVKVTRNIPQYPRHHVSYAPAQFDYCNIPRLMRRCIYKKIHWLTLTIGSRSREMLPSALYVMWPMHLQSLKCLGGDTFTKNVKDGRLLVRN